MTESEWRPIATAPKNGRESLFRTEELGNVVMYWCDIDERWRTGFDDDRDLIPTHWMPLPPPPKAQIAIASDARIAELEAALQKISDWKSHSSEFSVDHGSNGVRDFYRLIAKQALKGQP